jgi:hypothetical protein
MGSFFRHGDDVVVVWDADDPNSDVNLQAAYGIARALSVRIQRVGAGAERAARELETTAVAIEHQLAQLEQFETWGETVRKHGGHIVEKAAGMRSALQAEVDRLVELSAQLKAAEAE